MISKHGHKGRAPWRSADPFEVSLWSYPVTRSDETPTTTRDGGRAAALWAESLFGAKSSH